MTVAGQRGERELVTGARERDTTTAKCVNCLSEIWYVGSYQGWVHAHSWVSVCLVVSNEWRATPPKEK